MTGSAVVCLIETQDVNLSEWP